MVSLRSEMDLQKIRKTIVTQSDFGSGILPGDSEENEHEETTSSSSKKTTKKKTTKKKRASGNKKTAAKGRTRKKTAASTDEEVPEKKEEVSGAETLNEDQVADQEKEMPRRTRKRRSPEERQARKREAAAKLGREPDETLETPKGKIVIPGAEIDKDVSPESDPFGAGLLPIDELDEIAVVNRPEERLEEEEADAVASSVNTSRERDRTEGGRSRGRDRDRGRGRNQDRDRGRDRDQDHGRRRDRDQDRGRGRDRSQSRGRDRDRGRRGERNEGSRDSSRSRSPQGQRVPSIPVPLQHRNSQRVALLVDLDELERRAQEDFGGHLSANGLLEQLLQGRQNPRTIGYQGSLPENRRKILLSQGFDTLIEEEDRARKLVRLSTDALALSSRVDAVVIASTDPGLSPLVEYLAGMGLKVEIGCFGSMPSAFEDAQARGASQVGLGTESVFIP